MFDLEAKIEALLKEFADHLGNHDGVAAQPVHVHGAANEIIIAVGKVRDRLMSVVGLQPPSPTAVAEPADAPEPAPADVPAADEPSEADAAAAEAVPGQEEALAAAEGEASAK